MQKIALLLIISFSAISCTTLINKQTQRIKVQSSVANAKVEINDSIYELPSTIQVQRSKNNLSMLFYTDSLSIYYILKPSVSPRFIFGNLIFVHAAPLGHLVDLTGSKRFYYNGSININPDDSVQIITTNVEKNYNNFVRYSKKKKHNVIKFLTEDYPRKKGQWYYSASIPLINHFNIAPIDEKRKISTGYHGISTGIQYFYQDNMSVNFTISTTTDFFHIFTIAEQFDEYEQIRSHNITLGNNFKMRRFSLNYGINYSKRIWNIINTGNYEPNRGPLEKKYHNIGFALDHYYQAAEFLFIGIKYSPTIYRLNPYPAFHFEHAISLDFLFRFKISNKQSARR